MSEKFQNMVLTKRGSQFPGPAAAPHMEREYSEATQQYEDEEVARILEERYNNVLDLLTKKKQQLNKIAAKLLEIETLDAAKFYKMASL